MHYVKTIRLAFNIRMKLRVLDIDILLILVSIADGRRAILHKNAVCVFSRPPS